ncbi:MAG TPA: efflux RND transporter periplasmic adaptor subunit [Gemmatimonadales bacterium]|nr:efflux RND transporter periplasmic adaptor subunit [Gemmatimonadales bacterium]
MTRTRELTAATLFLVVACGGEPSPAARPAETTPSSQALTIRDTVIVSSFEAVGAAEAVQQATLSTRLMGNVVSVLVHEGDRVQAGATLVRLDAREISSKREQVEAGIAAAEAVYRDAQTQAARFRSLYADSAATRYQLEQVETGLTRAESGLNTARAARGELDAVGSYAEVRAPFPGVVTRRHVDPGAFAAPGAPLVEIQDPSRLRVTVSVPAALSAQLRRGMSIPAKVEGRAAVATIEGVVPSGAGTVYTVNALIENRSGELLAGSAATLAIPAGERRAILIPVSALVREGDLTGVRVQSPSGAVLRWLRLGEERDGKVEVLSGLGVGDVVIAGAD